MSSSPSFQIRPSTREIGVRHSGQLVHLSFHRVTFDIHYRDSLQIAQWIRLHSKEAKRKAKDKTAIAIPIYPVDQPYRASVRLLELPGQFHPQKLATKTGVSVWDFDDHVGIRIGRGAWGLHYRDALHLYGAIRCHAKASKIESGDYSLLRLTAGVMSDAELNYKRGI